MSVITIVSLRVVFDVIDVVDVPVSLDVPFAYNVAVLLTVL